MSRATDLASFGRTIDGPASTLLANNISVGNTSSNVTVSNTFITIGNSSVNATINSTAYTGSSNSANYIGTVSAANVVSNAQLQANLANYPSSFQLSANLANYQTTAGLNANVAVYLPNYTGVVNGSAHTVGTSTVANSTGVYTGVVNAASYTVGTSFVANTTGVYDSIGNLRNVIQNSQSSAYSLQGSDNGKFINITTGGITVPSGVFSAGQTVTIYNNSSSNQTITQGSGVTMYLVGTATTGNRTLAQYGLATVFCVASNTFVITGGGLT